MNPIRYVNGVIRAIHKQYLAGSGSYVNWVRPRNGATFRAGSVLLTLMLAQAGRPTLAQCYYTYQEIPHPPGNPPQFTSGRALNNLGHVAGRYSTGGDTARAFFWSPETGTYLLPYPPGIIDMVAEGINDLDQVCGWMTSTNHWYGFIWDRGSGEYTTIEMPAGATQIDVAGINNAGVVAGTLYFPPWFAKAYRWQNGVYDDLSDDLGVREGFAYDINDRSEVCGEGGPGADQYAYFLGSEGVTWLPRPAGFTSAAGEGLSQTGFVAGWGVTGSEVHGLVWQANSVHVIPPPSGLTRLFLEAVNDAGRAVGFADYAYISRAMVWQNGTLTDLNSLLEPGAPLRGSALAINSVGQILTGKTVLTPVWLPGDLTGDCHVSIEDLVLVLTNFGLPRGSFPRGDVDSDGEVDLTDLAILLAHWGE